MPYCANGRHTARRSMQPRSSDVGAFVARRAGSAVPARTLMPAADTGGVQAPRRALLLMGPTGAGKSDLAMRIAEEFPVEVISVDSALVYRGMDIGTAKPSAAMRARVAHHLIDIRDPAQRLLGGRVHAGRVARHAGYLEPRALSFAGRRHHALLSHPDSRYCGFA